MRADRPGLLSRSRAYDIVYRHAFAVNLNAITLHLGPLQVAFGSRRTVSLSTPKNRLAGSGGAISVYSRALGKICRICLPNLLSAVASTD